MRWLLRPGQMALALAVLAVGCAGPLRAPTAPSGGGAQAPQATTPKRMTAAIMGDAHSLAQKLNPASYVPGIDTLEEMVSAGLTNTDDQGNQRAALAEAVPTIENGLWKVLPDGRMETTWKIRSGAQWHDGMPITTDDLLFTAKVVQDPDLPLFRDIAYRTIETIEATDQQTVTVKWRAPLIRADQMFSRLLALPLPKHL